MSYANFDNSFLNALNRPLTATVNTLTPFYRRHPYLGELWITEIDMRVAISHEYRFLFNRIPKNANSSTVAMLYAQIHGETPETYDNSPKHSFVRPTRLRKAGVQSLDGYFKFCVLRNPYTRTLSAFLEKVGNRKRESRRPLRLLKKWYGTETPSFEQFCEYLDRCGLYDDNHWAPQTHSLVLPLQDFDFVGRFERLAEDLDGISRRIFDTAYTSRKRFGPDSAKTSELMRHHYTPRAREIVRRLYSEDFRELGYTP